MICPECNGSFEPKRPNQVYCTPQHARRASKKRARRVSQENRKLEKVVAQKPIRYSDEDREFYLRALAYAGGNAVAAQKGLKELGYEVTKSALYAFKRDNAERYAQLRDTIGPELKSRRAEAHEALADKLTDLSDDLIGQLHEAIQAGALKPHQLPGTLRDATVASGIHRDKAAKLRGEELKVVQRLNPDEIINQLKRIAPQLFIEGEATEITEKELPPAA
jgi:hypothetical protein